MQDIKNVLNEALTRLGIDKGVKKSKPLIYWDRVVGKKIAAHTKAVRVRKDILFVEASSPVWAQELSLMKMKLITKINNLLDEENAVKDIRFSGKGSAREHVNTEKQESKKKRARLSQNEVGRIESVVREIDDEMIQDKLKNLMINDKKYKKEKENPSAK